MFSIFQQINITQYDTSQFHFLTTPTVPTLPATLPAPSDDKLSDSRRQKGAPASGHGTPPIMLTQKNSNGMERKTTISISGAQT